MNQQNNKPKRHINTEHLAIVLLGALGIIFALTIVISAVLPKHTTPSELSVAEATEKAEKSNTVTEKNALSYEASSVASNTEDTETEDHAAILKLINSDLQKQFPSITIENVGENDVTFTTSGGRITAEGKYTSVENGSYAAENFTYVLAKGTDGSYSIVTRSISRSTDAEETGDNTSSSSDLPAIDSYDIDVNAVLHLGISMTGGEIRVDVVDEEGNVKTVFDETGPYSNDDVSIDLSSGHYQLKLYGNAAGWSFSYHLS